MAKEWAKPFYKSTKWKKCRDSYIAERIAIDGGMCETCKQNLGYIVHHKILLTPDNINDPDIALNHDCLEYDCKECHDQFDGHGVGKKTKLLCEFDSNGQPIPIGNNEKEKQYTPPYL